MEPPTPMGRKLRKGRGGQHIEMAEKKRKDLEDYNNRNDLTKSPD